MARSRVSLYAAIDVGTTKVATLVARVAPAGAMEIVALGHAASQGMRKGLVVSPDELGECVRRSAEEASGMLGKSLPPAHIGITGAHLSCVNAVASASRETNGKGPRAISQQDVDRLLLSTFPEAGAQRRVVHIIPRSYEVDAMSGVRSPIGMSGEKLSAESHVVLGDPAPMETLARLVRGAGLKVRGMVLEHLASAEAVLSAEERQSGAVLVDIGGGTSDIAIYKDGTVWHTAGVPVAGQHFTSDLAIGLGLPPRVAEKTKVEHGSARLDRIDAREYIEVKAGPNGHIRTIPRLAMNQLLHDRAVELIRLILHKVGQSGLDRMPAGGMVLTGGSASLPGLAEIAADYGNCPVRIGSPSDALGLPEELQHTSYSTAVGLLLWAIQHRHAGAVARDTTLAPPVLERLRAWFSRRPSRRATAVHA